jgi:predicted lipoprotein with Yx(FWY)xxD motif
MRDGGVNPLRPPACSTGALSDASRSAGRAAKKEADMSFGRRILLSSGFCAVVLGLAACGSSSSSSSSTPPSTSAPAGTGAGAAAVDLANSSTIGQPILVNKSGMTLYYLKGETAGNLMCTSSACLTLWSPLYLAKGASAPTAVAGIPASKLGTVQRPGGKAQVTFNGWPLYTFAGDTSPGQTKGQDVTDNFGTWFVVTKSGSSSTTGSGGGTTSSSGGSTSSGGSWS